MNISITKTTTPKVKPDPSTLGFGKVFTDHMFLMEYEPERGWYDARIVPFGNLSIHPAATVLHYGSEIFEGLKAYRRADGKVQLFRPIENIRRLNRSAERLCLPELPEELGMEVLTAFVNLEQDWTPSAPGTSLYLRPLMFGNDETLGVHAVHHTTFMIIASPVGSYYKEGINPVGIMIEDEDVRAVKGGTGYTKCGGNYGARAEKKGYAQVLWLDGIHRKYIEEVGAMNVMFKINGEIVTPMLSGMLMDMQVPGYAGDSAPVGNVGTMSNSGVELDLVPCLRSDQPDVLRGTSSGISPTARSRGIADRDGKDCHAPTLLPSVPATCSVHLPGLLRQLPCCGRTCAGTSCKARMALRYVS